jgi:hypothetical protein
MLWTTKNTVGVGTAAPDRSNLWHPSPARATALLGVGVAVFALALSACSLHVTKNGVSGNILGNKFSAGKSLPAGFPSVVPTPADAQVLFGAGGSNSHGAVYTVEFGVTSASIVTVFSTYEAQFRAAGFTVNVTSAPSSATTTSSAAGGTSVSISGAFTATGSGFQVAVSALDSSSVSGQLKAGEIPINVVVTQGLSTSTTT